MENLRDKLKSLGANLSKSSEKREKCVILPHKEEKEEKSSKAKCYLLPEASEEKKTLPMRQKHALESFLPVSFIPTPFGNAFVVEKEYVSGHRQGIVSLRENVDWSVMLEWERLEKQENAGFLFLDTETTGLERGTGTLVFLVGMGFWRANRFRLLQFFLPEPIQEPAMLSRLAEVVPTFQYIVTFNGKTFDIPILQSRYILNTLRPPFNGLGHLDLLPLARRLWKNRLPSRAMRDLERDILKFSRSQEDIPGWMIPEVYLQYLKTKDPKPLLGVFYHNEMDIVSLAALANYMDDLIHDPPHALHSESPDWIAVGHLYEDLGHTQKAIHLYQHSLEAGLPERFIAPTLMSLAAIYKKEKNWPCAIALWEKAAKKGDVSACIEIAKFYEHQEKNYALSQKWARLGKSLLSSLPKTMTSAREWTCDLNHREKRLQEKSQDNDHENSDFIRKVR